MKRMTSSLFACIGKSNVLLIMHLNKSKSVIKTANSSALKYRATHPFCCHSPNYVMLIQSFLDSLSKIYEEALTAAIIL